MFGYETLRDYEAHCRRVIEEEKDATKTNHRSGRQRWAEAVLEIIERIKWKRKRKHENLS